MKALQTIIRASLCIAGPILGIAAGLMPAAANPGQDLLVGNGTPGPYPLSWGNIDGGTEIVLVGQQTQMRGIDYTLDPVAGTITFVKPLTVQTAASVHYEYDPAHAVHGSVPFKVPLSFELAARGGSRVSLDALYQGAGGAAGTAPGNLTLGLGTTLQGGSGQLTTRLLFAPMLGAGTPQAPAPGAGNSWTHLGLSVSGGTQTARTMQFSFGYGRAGTGLTGASDNGLTAGRQTITLGTTLAPSKQVKASINWAQSDATTTGGGAASTQMSAAVSVAPASNLSLQTHWTDTTGAGAPETQTADIHLHAAPTAATTLDAAFASKSSADPTQNTQAMSLSAALAPAKTVAVNAGIGQTLSATGPVNQQQVTVALTPSAALHLQTGVALHQTDAAQTCIATASGQVQPVSFLQFAATYKSRTASAGDPLMAADHLDTSLLSVTVLPLRGVRLTGSYAQNPDGGGITPQALAQRGLGLETTLGLLSVSGGYDWQRPAATQIVGTAFHVGVGLHLSSSLQMDGTYKQTLLGVGDAVSGTNEYGFGLKRTLGDRFSLSMTGTMLQPIAPVAAPPPNYTANASLGMKF